jgi:hypothetical protein
MAKEFDYLAAARAASERIAGPLSHARNLFKKISRECDVTTARLIFQLCAQEAVEAVAEKKNQPQRQPMKLPTIARIDDADHAQICTWWERSRYTDQKFSKSEKQVIGRLAKRYVELGGYPAGYTEGKLPPIKKKGSIKRDAPTADLPALFDAMNPHSAFSIERATRGGRLNKREFAATLCPPATDKPTYGATPDHVLANLRYQSRKARI